MFSMRTLKIFSIKRHITQAIMYNICIVYKTSGYVCIEQFIRDMYTESSGQ